MSVSKISPIGSVDPPVGAVRAVDPASGSSQQSSQQDHKPPAQPEPVMRRFPWLSWETRQLEAASKQPSPYGRVPLLGETLDQKV